MSNTQGSNNSHVDAKDSALARLLRLAAPKVEMESERQERVTVAVRDSWRRTVAARRRRQARRRMVWAAAAAMVLVALGLGMRGLMQPAGEAGDLFAETLTSFGDVLVEPTQDGSTEALSSGRRLGSGWKIISGDDSYAALRLAAGVELRVDSGTTLRLDNERRVTLVSGAVYVDVSHAKNDAGSTSITVVTPLGEATDIGTRFEVRFEHETITVRVRDGQVELSSEGTEFDIDSGHELSLDKQGRLSRRPVTPFDERWSWTRQAAPTFDLHGRNAEELLRWLSEETGWSLRLSRQLSWVELRKVELRGSIEGLSATEALDTVLPTLGLDYEMTEGELRLHPLEMSEGEEK